MRRHAHEYYFQQSHISFEKSSLMNRRTAIGTIAGAVGARTAALSPALRALAASAQNATDAPLAPSPALPDPLVFPGGAPVRNARDWERRRIGILETARQQMYGVVPSAAGLRFSVQERGRNAFGGLARRTQVRLLFKGAEDGPSADLLLYTPRKLSRAPVILGLNFWGNHTVCTDPGILLNRRWVESSHNPFIDLSCVVDHRATESCRGIDARRWPIEEFLHRGYAFATMYRGDIDPDVADGSVPGIRAAYPELARRGDNFSAIAAWAWALSRSLDYLEINPHADARRVAVFGWSRLGKAAVWAGANDRRFAAIISHESGAGGAKLFRRDVGEDIHRLNTVFPHWFCRNFRAYNGMDRELPFDQHLILAAMAPRPLYIGSAAGDTNSDPEGEFTSGVLASAVYRFLGFNGLNATSLNAASLDAMPKPGGFISGRVSYQIRPGGHDVEDSDWQRYLDFLDIWLRAAQLPS
jgi:(4-O-methyl)-D-glucuronate---lignin esterase